jgi:hypothetical protein
MRRHPALAVFALAAALSGCCADLRAKIRDEAVSIEQTSQVSRESLVRCEAGEKKGCDTLSDNLRAFDLAAQRLRTESH